MDSRDEKEEKGDEKEDLFCSIVDKKCSIPSQSEISKFNSFVPRQSIFLAKKRDTAAVNRLREFLDSKKADIFEGKFVPSKENILAERDEFKYYESLNKVLRNWLIQNLPAERLQGIATRDGSKKEIRLNKAIHSIWTAQKEILFRTVHKFVKTNSNAIEEIRKNNDENAFYERLKQIIMKYLEDHTDMLENFNNRQLSLIPKLIVAVYLVMSDKPPSYAKAIEISGLSHDLVEEIMKVFNVKLALGRNTHYILNLERNEDFAEMIAISLGDGSLFTFHPINGPSYEFLISLNGVDEPEYVEYVAELMEKLFKKTPTREPSKKEKGIRLCLYGKGLVEELISHGLLPGDKIENQVSVPKWVFSDLAFVVRCLKGLTDTDGNIGIKKSDKAIRILFNNGSLPLVQDFKRMCLSIGVVTTNIEPDKRYKNNFTVYINKKDCVKKFLEIVKPELWKHRKHYLGMILISLGIPEISAKIEEEVKEFWRKKGKKISTYTKEFENFLENVCVKYGLAIDEISVNKAIDEALGFRK